MEMKTRTYGTDYYANKLSIHAFWIHTEDIDILIFTCSHYFLELNNNKNNNNDNNNINSN